jgi:thioesterase domain-containing protein/acyl carrier protein
VGAFVEADVRRVVGEVWAEVLPYTPFDEQLTWRESGVDSLKTLQFLLRLEQALGRPVSFDDITRDMTAGDLVRALTVAPAEDAWALDMTIFLVPGLFGDEPILAEFRKSLAGQVRFDTLPPPDIDQPISVLSDLKATAGLLVDQIQARQPTGPLYIGGYSVGGLIAFQAANDLIAAGREVRLVCLFDALLRVNPLAQLGAPNAADAESPLTIFVPKRGETLSSYGERLAFEVSRRVGLTEIARKVALANSHRHDLDTNYRRRRALIGGWRGRAMLTWRPTRCPAPALLITSDDFPRHCPVALWQALCPNLTVQAVPGHHAQIFDPPALAKLNPALLAALSVPVERAAVAAAAA